MSFLSNRFSYRRRLSNRDRRPIVFITSQLPNCDFIVQKIVPHARAIILGSSVDGVKEITRILKPTCCQDVYLIANGSPGCLYLGNSQLSVNTLLHYASELEGWFESEDSKTYFDSPKMFLYGCNVASGDVGEEFIVKLNRITKAEISASANIVNNNIMLNSHSD